MFSTGLPRREALAHLWAMSRSVYKGPPRPIVLRKEGRSRRTQGPKLILDVPKTLQLGLALPLERAAGQSNRTNNPSKNEVGLDVSHHTRIFSRGGESGEKPGCRGEARRANNLGLC